MSRYSLKTKRIFWGWLVSYIFILIIPMIAGSINYYSNVNSIKKGFLNAYELTLNNLRDNIDSYIRKETEFFEFVFLSDSFKRLHLMKEMDGDFHYEVWTLKKMLETYSRDDLEMDCMIYLEDKDFIINKSTANVSGRYYDTIQNEFSDVIEYEAWMDLINGVYNDEVFIAENINSQYEGECIIYARSLWKNRSEKVNILISFPMDKIEKLIVELPQGIHFMITAENGSYCALDCDGFIEAEEADRLEKEGSESVNNVLSVSAKAKVRELSYKLFIYPSVMKEALQNTHSVYIWNIIITVILGGMGILWCTFTNYSPIVSLAKKVGANLEGGNEFYNITMVYEALQKENASNKSLIRMQNKQLRNEWLLSCLKGRNIETNPRINDELLKLNLESKFAMVGFTVLLDEKREGSADELMYFVIDNIFLELMGDKNAYRVDDGNDIFYIFQMNTDEHDWRYQTVEKAKFLSDFLYDKWEVSVVCAVGDIVEEFEALRNIYGKMMGGFERQRNIKKRAVLELDLNMKEDESALVKKVQLFVRENYNNPNLNVSTVADGLGRSMKYVSRMFKEETGEGLLDYINQIRIEKAIEIMNTGNYVLEDVALMVGYSNSKAFRRAFMKIVGKMPSEYLKDTFI